jgi:hypothetical protein
MSCNNAYLPGIGLKAAVVQEHPPAVRFFVEPPSGWSEADQDRARHHFDAYGLGALYAAQAAQQLANLSYRLEQLAERAGPAGVKSYWRRKPTATAGRAATAGRQPCTAR